MKFNTFHKSLEFCGGGYNKIYQKTNIDCKKETSMEEVLRDRNGNRIGTIQDNGSELVLRDKNGNRCGTYNKSQNVTRDKNGNRVGTGNLLVTLLPR